jgi:hypothetical protein
MNPATAALLRSLRRTDIQAFVSGWDAFEITIIYLFREKQLTQETIRHFTQLRTNLVVEYGKWRTDLAPFVRQVRAAGGVQPFDALLAPTLPDKFLEDWVLMQALPAAREAINLWLISLIEQESSDI